MNKTFDYSAFQRMELDEGLIMLEGIGEGLTSSDKNARDEAKNKLESLAPKTVAIDPHLAYLWFWAKKEEAEKNNDIDLKKRYSSIATKIRDVWKSQRSQNHDALLKKFSLFPEPIDIEHLPPLSFMITIPFRLHKPYLSKDETDFYLLDNPVKTEKIFKMPMVAASSWKGALRSAFWHLGYAKHDEHINRLFGSPREGKDEIGKDILTESGCLYFYSSFFDKDALEVINPHDRAKGVTKSGPILIEAVPAYRRSTFILLYVPKYKPAETEPEICSKIAADLRMLADGIQAMMTEYGFGAKTSSGFGIIENELPKKGALVLHLSRSQRKKVEESEKASSVKGLILPLSFQSLTKLHGVVKQAGEVLTGGDIV